MIAALVKLNAIPVDGTWEFYDNIEEVATGLQVWLEMLIFFFKCSFKN